MSKVYFKAFDSLEDVGGINQVSYEMLKRVINEEDVSLDQNVPLKVHFGEPGNDAFIKPHYFDGLKKYLKENNISTCYIETNVLYKGARTYTKDHLKTAADHGFSDLDVIIADGDDEAPYIEVPVNLEFVETCKIGTKFANYNNYIVVAHFKGHGLAGMGGAIKQLAMGFASRGGKLHQHSNMVPLIDDACVGCGICVAKCPVDAIILEEKAVIDPKTCVGCAACTAACPVDAITNTWDNSGFHEKLAEYAYGAALNKTNIYINYAFNIAKDCDCVGEAQEIVAPDIGIFISTDPVAIDVACIDKVREVTGTELFELAEKTIDHATKIDLGNKEYELIEI